ncbi:DUF2442 domain-containing protein [Salmonella enterica]|nr:DUF2442 domain-containing protein [Salmonella enterica]EFR2649708.1 DUF2442 domain-containing protein [Salmonella enterica]EFS1408057.1 DUF2442 domain-containing protein [Salmonella enterica]EHQ8162504.1 DUF2442 domain-containing protein [Salmonella enterica]EJZ9218157.1 DUF2442 domain-containing protein [Salmonella enterica]
MKEACPLSVRFVADAMEVTLSDGRILSVPLSWFPRLAQATPEQRADYHLSDDGLHWVALDEDVSVTGLLRGFGDNTHVGRKP